MSFRTVVISKQSRISYKNHYLVVKQEVGEKYIHLSEIDTVIIDSISVSISSYLLKELCDSKIDIIFCDEKHNPNSLLMPLYSSHNSSKKIIQQASWKKNQKDALWQKIVINKIKNQTKLLFKIKSDNKDLLYEYMNDVKIGDKTNREGHAAKVYFNSLFGTKFSRGDNNNINDALNYGYTILLSSFNKEIVSLGYATQLGIHHKNEFNEFNLACDLMEPFRPIIDNFVYCNINDEFNFEYKIALVNLFNGKHNYKGKKYTLKDIIKMYTRDTIDALEDIKKYREFNYYEE